MLFLSRSSQRGENIAQSRLYLFGGIQPCAFELGRRIFMARAPQKALVVETEPRVVPTAVTGVMVDHSVGRRKLIQRMGEAGDHHHERARRAGQAGATRQTDKELSVL